MVCTLGPHPRCPDCSCLNGRAWNDRAPSERWSEPSALNRRAGRRFGVPGWAILCEVAIFLGFSIFFILYGLVPMFGGDGLGLVGADEPRYAQIAHEMLVRFDSARTIRGGLEACRPPHRIGCVVHAVEASLKDRLEACVTPYLYGRPWLEKPALYYWRAMFLFQDFGVHDWSARLPSATFAFIMVALIYLHMRRFRPGGHLDAALITAACAGIMGFSRGASTDMQMAAPLAIGLLGWYAWYETDSKFWLYDIYFFTGLATLAKGPVAPFLAMLIITSFGARCGGPASFSISRWCCPGLSPCSIRTPPSSMNFSWSTTCSVSQPTVISTTSRSGTTRS
jgi:hypothetical protein